MAKIKKIDHLGIVVSDIEAAIQKYQGLLFQKPSLTAYFAPGKIELAFFEINGVSVELLAPQDRSSEIGIFLKEKGEGMHHICYEVDDLESTLESLRGKGFKLIDQKPRAGSRNSRIAFVDPVSTGGVLTEYCQFSKT
jgi:methylmalonyl-CoA/ethylmalonyl-CoA epimerase